MLTFDLHYHANINCYRYSKINRDFRLKKHRKYLKKIGVNYVASTEHAYKNPLDAYLYLRDTADTLDVNIIPGVEWISREGVEIIFLFDSESSLRHGLDYLKPFSGSVWDIKHLKKETDSVTIIPHPFSPGKTGVATMLGKTAFLRLLNDADYVEIHNGLSLIFLNFKCVWQKPLNLMNKMKQIQYTFDLPGQFKPDHIGWAVGSDAHFPGHQFIVGGIDDPCSGADETDAVKNGFELLAEKVHFTPVSISPLSCSGLKKCRNLSMNGRFAMSEAIFKNVVGATVNIEKRVNNLIKRI